MQEAALKLFHKKGYEGTTTAEIAELAGVTERTFFRYFPDKREVLFNEAELGTRLDAAIVDAPAEWGPLEVVVSAFKSLASMFEENLPFAEPGQAVIARTPALQERQLAKTAAITRTIAEALQRRGVEPAIASLAAAAGMAVTAHGLQTWVCDPSSPLVAHFDNAFQTLNGLSRKSK